MNVEKRFLHRVKSIWTAVRDAVFPMMCIGCGRTVPYGEFFCKSCAELLHPIQSDKRCMKCGLSRRNCNCGQFRCRFEACIAPFNNTGSAKDAMYNIKFRRYYADITFFTDAMERTVRKEYADIHFDFICYCPASKQSTATRGFDQGRLLAEGLSKRIGVPLFNSLLVRNGKDGEMQHFLTVRDRFQNIKGKYSCTKYIPDTTVLLVDDIKTTGATLDECTRVLMQAGAQTVYAVTALITPPKRKKTYRANGETDHTVKQNAQEDKERNT